MKTVTKHAPAQGSLSPELDRDIKLLVDNPIMAEIMRLAGGMVVVVNEHRQIVVASESFLRFLGIEEAEGLLGKRLGEAVQCQYSDRTVAGCGTSLQCLSCGVVKVMLDAQQRNEIVESRSALQVKTGEGTVDLCVWVRACPVQFAGRSFVVLFLTDITEEERKYELERIFLHDALNTALGLHSACTLLERRCGQEGEARQYARVAKTLSNRLMKDLKVHKLLSETKEEDFRPDSEHINLREFLLELKEIVETWSVARRLRVEMVEPSGSLAVHADPYLVYRVMANMLLNACEASAKDEVVRFWAEKSGDAVALKVWNQAHIPEHIAPRIFQRHFSTKEGRGRGVGTYSMKFITERLLGGSLTFITSKGEGTVFILTLD